MDLLSNSYQSWSSRPHLSSNRSSAQPPKQVTSSRTDEHTMPIDPETLVSGAYDANPELASSIFYQGHGALGFGNAHSGHSVSHDSGRLPQYALRTFIHGGDQPWFAGKSTAQDLSAAISYQGRALSGYRSSTVPSDCGTLPELGVSISDSGYGSAARPSIGVPSVCGGEPEGGSDILADPFAGLQQLQLCSPAGLESHDETRRIVVEIYPNGPVQDRRVAGLTCPRCHQMVKTQSELKKHKARHEKPHRCREPDCKRDKGFGTLNDLERHLQSVHRKDGIKFRCPVGTCANRVKLWPRADNFRQHLKRVHDIQVDKDEEMDQYKERLPKHRNSEVLTCVGVAPALNPTFKSSSLSPPRWSGLRQESHDFNLPHDVAEMEDLLGRPPSVLRFPSSASTDFTQLLSSAAMQSPEPESEQHVDKTISDTDQGAGVSAASTEAVEEVPRYRHLQQDMSLELPVPYIRPNDLDKNGIYLESQCSSFKIAEVSAVNSKLIKHNVGSPPAATVLQQSLGVMANTSSLTKHSMDKIRADSGDCVRNLVNGNDGELGDSMASVKADAFHEAVKRLLSTNAEIEEPCRGETLATVVVDLLRQEGKLHQLLHHLGYTKAKQTPPRTNTAAVTRPTLKGKSVVCTHCGSTFNRQCDLRKHMKRHVKPYACTFDGCLGSFGSKNDWKRHENSQHSQMESWKCEEVTGLITKKPCDKVYRRRETFRNHLKKDHQLQDASVNEKLRSCRLECSQESFWCGFCVQLIQTNKEQPNNACAERFTHIEAHFLGKSGPEREISGWKSLERGDESDPTTDELSSQGSPNSMIEPSHVDTVLTTYSDGNGPRPAPERVRKRPLIDDDSEGSHKRPRRRISNSRGKLWYCCQCSAMSNVTFNEVCINCEAGHRRCHECTIERLRRSPE